MLKALPAFPAILAVLFLFATPVAAENPRVWLDTDRGPIIIELDELNAPITTQNFLAYVNEGFYDGLVFHRVIDEFVIQGGGFDRDFRFREPTRAAISSETNNGRDHLPGTLSMALSAGNINSARSQFFINTVANTHLNADFTVFGEVILGMNTVDTISSLVTGTQTTPIGNFGDAPVSPPVILRAVKIEDHFPIMPVHSGSWFDPSNPGVGFNLEVANDATTEDGPLLVAYWYDFTSGQQLWLTGTANFEYGASAVTIDLLGVPDLGAQADFLTPPPLASFQSRGTVTVRFDDCQTGRFAYDLPDFGSGELVLTRLTIPDRQSCDGI